MNTLNAIVRLAFLFLFLISIIVAVWHLSWLHKQTRYDIQIATPFIVILDREQQVVYATRVTADENIGWRTIPLPSESPK